ncbi:hypothetical protein NKH72_08170 [Mesorhizobium sp. M0955]|uniref:hypothetical protein n=1 Tax=unclassified Mesorhizobium TaxID=325217 RepID=UPI00333B7CBE
MDLKLLDPRRRHRIAVDSIQRQLAALPGNCLAQSLERPSPKSSAVVFLIVLAILQLADQHLYRRHELVRAGNRYLLAVPTLIGPVSS